MKWIRKSKMKYQWTKWFAWFPVDVGNWESIWWEYVQRKMKCDWGDCYWEYKK